jgi:hypothetical protein
MLFLGETQNFVRLFLHSYFSAEMYAASPVQKAEPAICAREMVIKSHQLHYVAHRNIFTASSLLFCLCFCAHQKLV